MSVNELAAKVAAIVAIVIGVVALGYVIVFAIAPIFLLASTIDFGFRKKYNDKVAALQGPKDLIDAPDIHDFGARAIDGRVMLAWLVDLPKGAQLDIYRLTGSGGGAIDDLKQRGECIHSTGLEFTNDLSEVYFDDGLPNGTYFYVPVVSGMRIERTPDPYPFLSFSREVHFSTRRTRVEIRGEASRVEVVPEEIAALPDTRDAASVLKDEVVNAIKGRKQLESELDAAIQQIRDDVELTDDEKSEAIELIETRAGSI